MCIYLEKCETKYTDECRYLLYNSRIQPRKENSVTIILNVDISKRPNWIYGDKHLQPLPKTLRDFQAYYNQERLPCVSIVFLFTRSVSCPLKLQFKPFGEGSYQLKLYKDLATFLENSRIKNRV